MLSSTSYLGSHPSLIPRCSYSQPHTPARFSCPSLVPKLSLSYPRPLASYLSSHPSLVPRSPASYPGSHPSLIPISYPGPSFIPRPPASYQGSQPSLVPRSLASLPVSYPGSHCPSFQPLFTSLVLSFSSSRLISHLVTQVQDPTLFLGSHIFNIVPRILIPSHSYTFKSHTHTQLGTQTFQASSFKHDPLCLQPCTQAQQIISSH